MAGSGLTLSAGRVLYWVIDFKKKHQIGDILELVEELKILFQSFPFSEAQEGSSKFNFMHITYGIAVSCLLIHCFRPCD